MAMRGGAGRGRRATLGSFRDKRSTAAFNASYSSADAGKSPWRTRADTAEG